MRKIGHEPLTGAQKQRRHRQRVKARLAEAEALKLQQKRNGGLPEAVRCCYLNALIAQGADLDECAILLGAPEALQQDFEGWAIARAERELEALRGRRRKRGSSLLERLSAIKPASAN